MDTQTQIDRLIELAIIQRSELKQLVEQLPQLREHLNAEVEKVFEETEPQLRSELEEWTSKQAADKTAALGIALEAKIANLAKSLEISTQARYSAIIAEREENARLAAQAEAKIAEHAASLPSAVKEIVSAELARFPRAGEIDQLRKEFAEPRGLNPRGKWQAGETYNRLDLVTYNGDSFVSNIDGNTEKPSRNAANWTLNAARGAYGGGGGITSLNDVLNAPTSGQIIGSQNGQYVPKTLVAGANITINETASSITIIGDEGQISLQDGTAAAPSLFFTNDTDTGLYRPTANTLGISVSGTQVAYFDANGITTVGAGATFDGSVHAANGNANNPSLSFTSDDNTGFFRHQPDEIGITLGGTQKATLTSTTFSITPNLSTSGNLTVSGTGVSSVAGTLNVTGALLAHQTAALNMAYEGSSLSQLVAYGADASTYGRANIILRKAGTGVGAVTALALTSTDATFGGNLTLSGTTSTITLGSTNTANVAVNSSGALTVTSANGQTLVSQTTSGAHYIEIKRASQSTGQVGLSLNGGTSGNTWLMYQPASSNTLTWFGNSANRMSLDTSGNLTLDTGNLTVSGNGLNTFGGTGATNASILFGANNVANASAGYLSISQRLNYGFALFGYNMTGTSGSDAYTSPKNATGSAGVELIGGSLGITRFIYSTAATTAGNALTVTEAARFSSGNLLLKSDGVDSGNGKLQLATHTTSAGGIGFGTDVSLWRTTANILTFGANNACGFYLRDTNVGTNLSEFYSDTAQTFFGTKTALPLIIRTNNTTALTLDSSQNATFAGTVTATGSVSTSKAVVGGSVVLSARNTDNTNSVSAAVAQLTVGGASAGDPRLLFTIDAVQDWSVGVDNSDGDKFKIGPSSAVGTSTSLTLDPTTGNATFAGAIAIGNTVQTAAAVASTHKVTVVIGGSTYYLLATNV